MQYIVSYNNTIYLPITMLGILECDVITIAIDIVIVMLLISITIILAEQPGGGGVWHYLLIIMIIIMVIIIITRPKPAYGRQGLAGGSLRASGAQLGSGKLQTHTAS